MTESQALIAFNVLVLGILAVDLGVFHRRVRAPSFREAALWSGFWVMLSLAFNAFVYTWRGPQPALEFFTAYVLENSLSMDNVFVFGVIFSSMAVPTQLQHKVLFWGVLGALTMRSVFIIAGATLISRFHWALYLFGGFLLITSVKLLLEKQKKHELEGKRILRWARKVFPITQGYEGTAFFVRRRGRLIATPLFLALLLAEMTDLVFAIDSVPAVLTVTGSPFLAYTSNALAMLGLRSLYFLLAGALIRLRYLRPALALVLAFLGSKMLLEHFYRISVAHSLLVVFTILGIAVAASLRRKVPAPDPREHRVSLNREVRPACINARRT
jgi:tellurite resistance protein TerC